MLGQLRLPRTVRDDSRYRLWQRRFYPLNVCSAAWTGWVDPSLREMQTSKSRGLRHAATARNRSVHAQLTGVM